MAEIANQLELTQQTVRNWMDAGKLPALHIGRCVQVKRTEFERLADDGYMDAATTTAEAAETIWDGGIPLRALL